MYFYMLSNERQTKKRRSEGKSMKIEEGQDPNKLLAILVQKMIRDKENINEVCAQLESIRRQGLLHNWIITLTSSGLKEKPIMFEVELERFPPDSKKKK